MVKTADHSAVIYGTHFPNRVFVGCLPSKANAQDLADFFCHFGLVNEAKIVLDENGNSKRFGFVSFGNQEGVEAVLRHGSIFFLGKKINVGRAVKKRFFDDVEGQPVTVTVDGVKKKTKEEGVKPHVIYETVRSALPVAPAMPTCFMMDNRSFPGTSQVYNRPPNITPVMYQPPNYPQATMLIPVQRMPMTTAQCVPQQAVNHGSSACSFRPCFPSFPAPMYYPQHSYTVSSRSSPSFWSGNSSPSTTSSQSPRNASPVLLQQPLPSFWSGNSSPSTISSQITGIASPVLLQQPLPSFWSGNSSPSCTSNQSQAITSPVLLQQPLPSFWSGNLSPSTIASQSNAIALPVLPQQPLPLCPVKENEQSSMYLR
eukprot:Seg18.2 transcript_id=Seg18.2/GoldUCD/mRNA.D3Y31 product="Protein boule-like" protein_id=Seg18.2/GoldUCD/D3Y31